jgi:hypothetical protein
VRLNTGVSRAFDLSWQVPGSAGSVRLRVAALVAGKTVALSSRSVRVVSKSAHARPVVQQPRAVRSLPTPGQPGQVVLSGTPTVTPGQILAIGYSPGTPEGFLGQVQSVSTQSGQTVVQTVPATLGQAVGNGHLDLADLKQVGAGAAYARSADARVAGDSVFNPDIGKSFGCGAGGSLSLGGSVTLGAKPSLKASFSLFHGLTSASFSADVTASADIKASATAGASCTLEQTPLLAAAQPIATFVGVVGVVPVVIVLQGQVYVDGSASAQAAVNTDVHASASLTGGISYDHGSFSAIKPSFTPTWGFDPPTLSGTASVSLHIEPALQLLLYGVAGPQLSLTTGLDFNANTATTPWWTLTAPLEVDASLTAPDLGLSSGNLVLYQKNPPFLIAQATTAPAAPPPAPPAPKVPSSGPTLIYQFDTAGNESEDLSFDDWAAATGQDADTEATLPTDLSSYRCVVLDLNQSFASGDEAALSSYLQAGGTILVLGEAVGFSGCRLAGLRRFWDEPELLVV